MTVSKQNNNTFMAQSKCSISASVAITIDT